MKGLIFSPFLFPPLSIYKKLFAPLFPEVWKNPTAGFLEIGNLISKSFENETKIDINHWQES